MNRFAQNIGKEISSERSQLYMCQLAFDQIAVQFFVKADLLCTRTTAASHRQAWVYNQALLHEN